MRKVPVEPFSKPPTMPLRWFSFAEKYAKRAGLGFLEKREMRELQRRVTRGKGVVSEINDCVSQIDALEKKLDAASGSEVARLEKMLAGKRYWHADLQNKLIGLASKIYGQLPPSFLSATDRERLRELRKNKKPEERAELERLSGLAGFKKRKEYSWRGYYLYSLPDMTPIPPGQERLPPRLPHHFSYPPKMNEELRELFNPLFTAAFSDKAKAYAGQHWSDADKAAGYAGPWLKKTLKEDPNAVFVAAGKVFPQRTVVRPDQKPGEDERFVGLAASQKMSSFFKYPRELQAFISALLESENLAALTQKADDFRRPKTFEFGRGAIKVELTGDFLNKLKNEPGWADALLQASKTLSVTKVGATELKDPLIFSELWIHPNHWKKGIGRALLRTLERSAIGQKHRLVIAATEEDHPVTPHLLTSMGFVHFLNDHSNGKIYFIKVSPERKLGTVPRKEPPEAPRKPPDFSLSSSYLTETKPAEPRKKEPPTRWM